MAGMSLLAACGGGSTEPSGPSSTISGCEMFPPTAIFNTRIDDTAQYPVHPNNAAWKNLIDTPGKVLHPDWGNSADQSQHGSYFGIPYNVVDGSKVTTNWPQVTYSGAPDESDCAVPSGSGGYNVQRDCSGSGVFRLPIPTDATIKIEGGYCPVGQPCDNTGDRHILVVDKATCRLWETGGATEQSANGAWDVYASAEWDLNSLSQRPATWTSADAAGLPILPLLVRADEADAGEIKHALRVTLLQSHMARAFDWPARHQAGSSGQIPFGALMRLKGDFAIPSSWTTQAKAVATAMKRYGMYVADNGSDMLVQGEPSVQWQDATLDQLKTIASSQFEFVSLNSIKSRAGFNANSLAASW